MVELFWDIDDKAFYDIPVGQADLFKLPRSIQDNAVPSGAATATMVLLKLVKITGNEKYARISSDALRGTGAIIGQHPLGFGYWLSALDLYIGPSTEVAIIGDSEESAALALSQAVCRRFRPNTLVAGTSPSAQTVISNLPLFHNRPRQNGLPTAYACHNFSCLPPVTDPEDLDKVLNSE
jgi:hypothetical protein